MRKYRNKHTFIDGIKFDSKKEAERYIELKLLEKTGEISDLELQPKFHLLPTTKWNGKTLRKISYTADFKYKDKNGKTIVEDVKGYKTDKYRLKMHMLIVFYPDIEFREI